MLFGTARNAGALSKVTNEEQDMPELDPAVRMAPFGSDPPERWLADKEADS